jgi:hypothetical protein
LGENENTWAKRWFWHWSKKTGEKKEKPIVVKPPSLLDWCKISVHSD